MTSQRFNKLQEDVEDEDFLLRIDMNSFKSIWGLMLGILLLGLNRPTWAGLTLSVVQECQSPRSYVKAQGRSRFNTCSRKPACINFYCKLGIRRDQPGHEYEP